MLTSEVHDGITSRPLKARVTNYGRVKFISGHDGHRTYHLTTSLIGERATDVAYKEGPGFGVLQVAFHETVIVEASDANITLDAGVGTIHPFSRTVLRRMNQTASEFSLGYKVIVLSGAWYVSWRGLRRRFPSSGVIRLEA